MQAQRTPELAAVQLALVSGLVMQWMSHPDTAPDPEAIAASREPSMRAAPGVRSC